MEAQQRVALVTGANKGIGFEVSRQLGKAGYLVLLGARNAELGRAAAATLQGEGLKVEAIELDLDRPETLAAVAGSIGSRFSGLDVLVNNAGIADFTDGPPSVSPPDVIERTMRTNFLGAVMVTQALLPLLRKATSARIVNVSSGLGSLTQNGDPTWPFAAVKYLGYSASKAALNMFTVQLAYELRETAIKVNAADPGYTATDMNHNSGHQTVEQGAAETVRLALLPEDGPTGTFSDTAGLVPW